VEHKSQLHSYLERESPYHRSVCDQTHHERTGYSFRKKLFNQFAQEILRSIV